uniref:Hypotheticial protein n=2 Tax=Schistosoma japonicum TaxID=6182 RepID=C7TYM5_SCHJA|nr:hypotheticial protein [Schistosoma japonicum]
MSVYTESKDTAIVEQENQLDKICDNPDVKKYISNCVESLRPQFSDINELRVVIKSISACSFESKPIESIVLHFDKLNEEFIKQDICLSLLQEYFATILIQLKMLDSILQPFEFETTWEPWVQFCSPPNQNENPTMSWRLVSNNTTDFVGSGSIYPIKSFHTDDIQMQVFLLQY